MLVENDTSISIVAEQQLKNLLTRYARSERAIPVNFRKMLSGECFVDRFTHSLHPYPAKLLAHIPYFFLRNSILSEPGDSVLDVFSGSGTVLLEAVVANRRAYGIDCNPLARLISQVKTTPLEPDALHLEVENLFRRIPKKSTIQTPDVHNISYWYYPHVVEKLKCIKEAITEIQDQSIQDFFAICFSKLARHVSLADPRLSVPVRLKIDQYPEDHFLYEKTEQHRRRLKRINVINEYEKILVSSIQKMSDLWRLRNSLEESFIAGIDAKNISPEYNRPKGYSGLANNSVQLVITSPPYPGAQKYIRSCFLNIGWLEMEPSDNLLSLKMGTIGREELRKDEYTDLVKVGLPRVDRQLSRLFEISPVRASIAAIYLNEMREVFDEIYRVLKPGGYLVLVASNSEICKTVFKTQDFLREMCLQYGFKDRLRLIDVIKSRGLMTKRNKTAGMISREWVHLLEKQH